MPSFDFTLQSPSTKDDILARLKDIDRASTQFWNSFDTKAFFAPVGTGWSPAGNVFHLNKATRPLVRALKLPRLLLRILFGKAPGPSGNYAGLRDRYLGLLANGASAGSFGPRTSEPLGSNEADRAKLMAIHESLTRGLANAIGRWSESDLDLYRLPHPLLGKLTVREMLFFTVYHNYHHPRSVAARLSGNAV